LKLISYEITEENDRFRIELLDALA